MAGIDRRTYRMRKRQEAVAETRERIIAAAVRLHGSVGPAHTTISAVADEAGVQRSTVYRHFADEAALFGACTSHWMAAHPWPRAQDWERVGDPVERLRFGLREVYAFFDENREMLDNSFRDIEVMPSFVGEMVGAFTQAMVAALLEPWPPKVQARPGFAAVVRAVVDFRLSRAFIEAGLTSREAADAVTEMVSALAAD